MIEIYYDPILGARVYESPPEPNLFLTMAIPGNIWNVRQKPKPPFGVKGLFAFR